MKKHRTKHTSFANPTRRVPESMTALAVGMADDFNNILTTVMGACTLIDKDDHANDDLLQYVALIRTSAERAANLSDKLMRAGTPEQHNACDAGHSHDSVLSGTSVRDNADICVKVPTSKHPDGAAS